MLTRKCCFSSTALLAGLALVGTVVVASFFLKYKGTMALVSTNSRAIAAACHAPPVDRTAGYLLPVKWGVVEYHDGVGKCTFTTAADMMPPEDGKLYK